MVAAVGAAWLAACGAGPGEVDAGAAEDAAATGAALGMDEHGASRDALRVALGRRIFFDANLSEPPGQSCASCHAPETGFTSPDPDVNAGGAVMPGAFPGRFGNRKPPSAAYATPSPLLAYDEVEGLFSGGVFFDGRATGWRLGSPTAEQALGPFLNPLEQNLPDKAEVIRRICGAEYGWMFRAVWGRGACRLSNTEASYDAVGLSVAAFEDSPAVNKYSSKFDLYLRGKAQLTAQELAGLDLFENKASCAACHVLEPADRPLFTDNTFDNLGVPKNPANPFYSQASAFNPAGAAWIDPGLGGFLQTLAGDPATEGYAALAPDNMGKQRVPTLRNVDKRPYPGFVKSYGHNGVFKSLKQIVHFYNTAGVLPACPSDFAGEMGVGCWPEPEVAVNVNRSELGDLGLTDEEEDAIVAFLGTLSDGWRPPRRR
jgi:cytochrome c peroxidase